MREKNNTTIYEKLIKSKVFFIFLIPIILTLSFGIFQQAYFQYQIRRDINGLNSEIADFSRQKEDLQNLIDYYKNNANIENEARIRLNLKKEGENVIIILPTATSSSNGNSGEDENSAMGPGNVGTRMENLPNYKQWWYYFFGE